MNNKNIFILAAITLLTASCGGGDGNSETGVSITQGYTLAKIQSLDTGTLYSAPLTGYDSNDTNYLGSFRIYNLSQELLDGILVTPSVRYSELDETQSPFTETATTETKYFDTNGDLVLFSLQETDLNCTPDSQYRMPNLVTINESGQLPLLRCDDNSTLSHSWNVEDAGGSNALLVTLRENRNSINALISTTTTQVTINQEGDILAIKSNRSNEAPAYTLTYESL